MSMINTVRGVIDSSELGITLSHEHVLLSSAGIKDTFPYLINREDIIRKAVDSLIMEGKYAVRTIMDVTTMDAGRDVRLLERVSKEAEINIICSTGIWMDIPRIFWNAEPDDVADLFIREIRDGIEGTGIKPGLIKVASHAGGVTKEGEIILRAAGRANLETGIPITTHTYASEQTGFQQIKILEDEGVDLNNVYIGHSDDSLDIDYLKGMLERGVWLGMDHLTFEYREGLPNLSQRLKTIKELIDSGYENKLMLGHDWAIAMPIFAENLIKSRDEYNPYGYEFIRKIVIPELLRIGVTERVIHAFMVINPSKFLTGEH